MEALVEYRITDETASPTPDRGPVRGGKVISPTLPTKDAVDIYNGQGGQGYFEELF